MPVYAVVSFGDIYLQGNSVYLQPWASVYEAFALASFFMLVNTFISPDHSSEAAFFDKVKLKSGKTAGAAWFNVRLGYRALSSSADHRVVEESSHSFPIYTRCYNSGSCNGYYDGS